MSMQNGKWNHMFDLSVKWGHSDVSCMLHLCVKYLLLLSNGVCISLNIWSHYIEKENFISWHHFIATCFECFCLLEFLATSKSGDSYCCLRSVCEYYVDCRWFLTADDVSRGPLSCPDIRPVSSLSLVISTFYLCLGHPAVKWFLRVLMSSSSMGLRWRMCFVY